MCKYGASYLNNLKASWVFEDKVDLYYGMVKLDVPWLLSAESSESEVPPLPFPSSIFILFLPRSVNVLTARECGRSRCVCMLVCSGCLLLRNYLEGMIMDVVT